ncbi:hypothetical protein QBC47DRAFT_356776 [Echria macrotheca]|uniref:SH3 domain-containing protein n=1 Tax=Echria macrotheca TaxID=438768 RepID=A0AAJ0FCZ9_9PEZI|nr:hypothetical protein QBC47DRAFT_356776 [Echria macrotheca]
MDTAVKHDLAPRATNSAASESTDERWTVVTPELECVPDNVLGASKNQDERAIQNDSKRYPDGGGDRNQIRLGSGETLARVLYTFTPVRYNELGVIAGEHIAIVAKGEAGWWLARDASRKLGWVPKRFVEIEGNPAAGVSNPMPAATLDEQDELLSPWIAITFGMRSVESTR